MTVRIDLLRRAQRYLFVSALFSVIGAPACAAKDSVPDWVRTAAAQKLPAYPPETNAVILLDDTTYTVAPDGTAIEHNRSVMKILRPQGRDEGIVYLPFDKDSKILSMHVWSIGPDGHEYAVPDKEIVEFGHSGSGILYADVQYKAAKPPGRDPGGSVACEYEQRMLPYIAEKTWFFQGTNPRLNQTFTLELPAGFTYGTVWAHHSSQKEADLENLKHTELRHRTP